MHMTMTITSITKLWMQVKVNYLIVSFQKKKKNILNIWH